MWVCEWWCVWTSVWSSSPPFLSLISFLPCFNFLHSLSTLLQSSACRSSLSTTRSHHGKWLKMTLLSIGLTTGLLPTCVPIWPYLYPELCAHPGWILLPVGVYVCDITSERLTTSSTITTTTTASTYKYMCDDCMGFEPPGGPHYKLQLRGQHEEWASTKDRWN